MLKNDSEFLTRSQETEAVRTCKVSHGSHLHYGNWQHNPVDNLTGAPLLQRDVTKGDPLLCSVHFHQYPHFDQFH